MEQKGFSCAFKIVTVAMARFCGEFKQSKRGGGFFFKLLFGVIT